MSRPISISVIELQEYLDTIELSGITKGHLKEVKRYLENYLIYVKYKIGKSISLNYFKKLKDANSNSYYRKQLYQILKFLNYNHIEWAHEIKLPPAAIYTPKRISIDDIKKTLSYFNQHKYDMQMKAAILLGASSGMRAEEIYQLKLEDIDTEKRTIHINHNPHSGQTTKTGKSRISFFNREAQKWLSEYLDCFSNACGLMKLFSQKHMERAFKQAPIMVKDLRKFFSQEWDRRGGSTSIKKILMGHSMRNDVDLMHYNAQSEEDLKKIYDKVNIHLF